MWKLLVVALAASGCSFAFQEHLATDRVSVATPASATAPACSTSLLLPIVDGLLGATAIGTGIMAVAESRPDSLGVGQMFEVMGATVIGEGVVFAASAVIGAHWASQCRSAHEAWVPTPAVAARSDR